MALDELELELRRLPGVRSVGFSTGDDFLMVQVHVSEQTSTTPTTAFETARIARRHSILPVSVEIVRWKSSDAKAARPAATPVANDAHADHSGSIQAFEGMESTIDLEFEAQNEPVSPSARPETDGFGTEDNEEEGAVASFEHSGHFDEDEVDLDEVLLSDFDDIDENSDPRDAAPSDASAPPRISPITSVINSFADQNRRIVSEERDTELEPAPALEHDNTFEPASEEASPPEEIRSAVGRTEPFAEATAPADSEGTIDLTINPAVDERVRLLAVLPFPESDEIEVHLTAGGRRAVGRAPASHGLSGAAAATLDALRGFIPEHSYAVSFAHRLPEASDQFLVVAGINEPDATLAPSQRFGVAASNSPSEAAARATLHALNRTLGIAKTRVHA